MLRAWIWFKEWCSLFPLFRNVVLKWLVQPVQPRPRVAQPPQTQTQRLWLTSMILQAAAPPIAPLIAGENCVQARDQVLLWNILNLSFWSLQFFPEYVPCPLEKPFPLHEGLECCRYHLRGANCTSGDPGTILQKGDHSDCCINEEKTLCGNGNQVHLYGFLFFWQSQFSSPWCAGLQGSW